MSEYVTVILSRDEAVDFCRTYELLTNEKKDMLSRVRAVLESLILERMYRRVMRDIVREAKEAENVR